MTTLLNPWKIGRRTTRGILSAVLISAVHAQCIASEGLYAGVGIGGSFLYGKLKNVSPIESKKVRKSGNLANAFIGYNHIIADTPLFTGFEFGASNHAIKKMVTGTYPADNRPYTFSVSTNNSLHGLLKLGFTVSNVSFYCKAGITQTNFKTVFSALGKDKADSSKKYGASTGFGVEAKMNKNFSLGFEHLYTKYGSLRSVAPDVGAQNMRMRLTPEIHLTSLRLIYNF